MIIKADGNCQKCGREFSENDTVQSVNVVRNRCGKRGELCSTCKNEGCECGGRFLDSFEQTPGWLH